MQSTEPQGSCLMKIELEKQNKLKPIFYLPLIMIAEHWAMNRMIPNAFLRYQKLFTVPKKLENDEL